MNLMIIESPGKLKKLATILGDDWKIAASVGHIRDLPQKEIGVHAPDFSPDYELTERGKGVLEKLKALAKQADKVYLATDPDREGEAISWHLQECLRLKNPIRVSFGEITPKAVNAAIQNPGKVDMQLVAAQEARRVLDRLVGYRVSPELSRQSGQRLSAGRVQSPAVFLVVERERQIKAFKVTNHFGAILFFPGQELEGEWSAEWQTKPDFVTDDTPYFMDRSFAEVVAAIPEVEVIKFTEGETKRSPPPPFTTSTLQQAASVALGMNPKETMDLAQKLYEQGHITYHRTDNPNISEESLPVIASVAALAGLDMANSQRKFKAPDGAQAGHPAITPTHWNAEEAGETPEQQALYQLIRIRAIACQLADARYSVRAAHLQGTEPSSGKTVTFEGRGRTLTYSGWLKLLAGDQTEEGEGKEPANPIPKLAEGQRLTVGRGKLLEKKTKPPSRYTQASLVKKLDSEGIGRPATYAAIMENITARGYVSIDSKKFLQPTDTGELVIDSLVGKFAFIDLGFTRDLESQLDRIASGQARYRDVIGSVDSQLQRELDTLQVTAQLPVHACPACTRPLWRIKGGNGWFWGCTGYPDCKVTLPDSKGKPGERKQQALSEFSCQCGKPLVHKIKKGKGGFDFWGCSGYPSCKTTYQDKDGKPVFQQ